MMRQTEANTQFHQMKLKHGPSRGTFRDDFKWLTIAAQNMSFLQYARPQSLRLVFMYFIVTASA